MNEMPTRRSSEREPSDSRRDKVNDIGGWLPSLTFTFGRRAGPAGTGHLSVDLARAPDRCRVCPATCA